MAAYLLQCADCGREHPEDNYYIGCPTCGGFLEVKLAPTLTAPTDNRYRSIFRYHPVMPYDPTTDDIESYETIEETAVIPAERLSERLGIELYFKDETSMPTGTWKDREGFVSIHRLLRSGIRDFFVFSSGNTGTSLARSASLIRGPRLHLVLPEASRDRLANVRQFFDDSFVKLHYHNGSNDECIAFAKQLAQKSGIRAEGGFFNYARREGLKLLGLELILGWRGQMDWYVQPVAGGIGIYSLDKAYRDLGRPDDCPRILGVQAEACAPMVNAWRAGAATLDDKYVPREVIPSDYVRVLRTRRPADSYPILKRIMDRIDGRFEDVNDQQIHEGLRLLYLDDPLSERLSATRHRRRSRTRHRACGHRQGGPHRLHRPGRDSHVECKRRS